MEKALEQRRHGTTPVKRPRPKASIRTYRQASCPNTGYDCQAFTGNCELIESSRHAQTTGVALSRAIREIVSRQT